MDNQFCVKCGRKIEKGTAFCGGCGTKCNLKKEYVCSSCGKGNPIDVSFCNFCGSDIAKQMVAATLVHPLQQPAMTPTISDVSIIEKIKNAINSYAHAKIIIIAMIVLLLATIGSFLYFNFTNESRYLVQYSEASRKIIIANDVLTSNINPVSLKSTQINDLQQIVQEQKNEIDRLEKDFTGQKSPDKYIIQHKNMIELLRLENSILQQSVIILANPLKAETDNLLSVIKNNIDEAKNYANQVQVPNTTMTFSSDMSILPHQLTIYVEEKRKMNKEKMVQLAAMNEFFKNTDSIIQRYAGAKDDLGGLLENLRKGGYNWNDYFRALSTARSSRSGLRYQVDNLNAPKGAEDLKSQLSGVLTQSIRYCDIMTAAANVEFSNNLYIAQPKYNEAKTVNADVQSKYATFISVYQTEKNRLTNIDNL